MATNGINGMTLETASLAGGDIEMMFLQQKAQDPFTATPERTAQVDEVASRIADFIDEARATLEIAIYDFHLHDDAARIIANALRSQCFSCARRNWHPITRGTS